MDHLFSRTIKKDVSAGGSTGGRMLDEAEKQTQALGRIAKWRLNAVTFAAFGLILGYCGLVNKLVPFGLGVVGIAAAVLCAAFAVLAHISVRHGKKNVENIQKFAMKK